jgi:hypothetical protein
MLRWLMSWCVPARALRFHTNFNDPTRQDLSPTRQNA